MFPVILPFLIEIWQIKFTVKWSSLRKVFKYLANTLRAPQTDCFWKSIYCFTKKCAFQNMSAEFVIKNKAFSKNVGKPLITFTACNFKQKCCSFHWYFLEHLPIAASENVTKHAVSPQPENMMVYRYTMVYSSHSFFLI